MPQIYYSPEHKAFVKECIRCSTTYIGHGNHIDAERILSGFFSSDRATTDGFYGTCKNCVSRYQRAKRDGRNCDPDKLMSDQNNKCGICEKPINYNRSAGVKVTAYIDHDHQTGKVRGLLCTRCNTLLPIVEDINWLKQSINYLRKYGWEFKCE